VAAASGSACRVFFNELLDELSLLVGPDNLSFTRT
jgi:hypothetical protein